MNDKDDLQWFIERDHWVIRRVPMTKDQYYVACGWPPYEVLSIYGIKY